MQDQFQMFAKILNDKQTYDDNDRMHFFSNYAATNTHHYQRRVEREEYQADFNSSKRLSRAIEDTGSIISDYTEDVIDVPCDDEDNYKEHNENIFTPHGHKHTVNALAPSTASLPNTTQQQQNRRSNGTKRNQRHSASLTREGEKREKKRRTRSNNVRVCLYFSLFVRDRNTVIRRLID